MGKTAKLIRNAITDLDLARDSEDLQGDDRQTVHEIRDKLDGIAGRLEREADDV